MLLGIGLALLPTALAEQTTVRRDGANRPINAGAAEPRDLTSHNSPTLVRSPEDPRLLAVTSRIDTPDYGCALHVSSDGGRTWSQTPVPAPRGDPDAKCFAPDAAFGADGTLHLSFVTLQGRGNVPAAGWHARSEDGGRTFGAPTRVLDELAFQVRIVADPKARDRLWLTWVQAAEVGLRRYTKTSNPIRVTRTVDGGRTWSSAARVSDPRRARTVSPTPAAAAGGRLAVLYLDMGDDRLDYEGGHEGQGGPPHPGPWSLVLARSRDAGATWSEHVVEERLAPIERTIVFTAPFPSLVLSPDGREAFAAFHDARSGDPDVLLWSSSDGGAAWGRPVRVNDTPRRDGTTQSLPQLARAPDGRIDVLYYDRRADHEDVMTETSLQSRLPKGGFTPRLRLSDRAFDSRVGSGVERSLPDLGSRLGLVAGDGAALAVWADGRGGTPEAVKQDLAFAAAAVAREPGAGGAVRIAALLAGLALAGAGLAVGVRWRPRFFSARLRTR